MPHAPRRMPRGRAGGLPEQLPRPAGGLPGAVLPACARGSATTPSCAAAITHIDRCTRRTRGRWMPMAASFGATLAALYPDNPDLHELAWIELRWPTPSSPPTPRRSRSTPRRVDWDSAQLLLSRPRSPAAPLITNAERTGGRCGTAETRRRPSMLEEGRAACWSGGAASRREDPPGRRAGIRSAAAACRPRQLRRPVRHAGRPPRRGLPGVPGRAPCWPAGSRAN
jgi:hypothetical protein